jgi:hypothetical protein
MTIVERLVELAKKHYAEDLTHGRYSLAITGAAKLIHFADRIEPTTKDRLAAEQLLKESTSAANSRAETIGGRQ